MARPKKQIDVKQIERLAAIGCTVGEIASVTGCSKRTLETRFCASLKRGRRRGHRSLRRMQWKAAKSGNVTMQIWLGKQMLRQKDKSTTEHTGANGGPIMTKGTLDLNGLSVDEVRNLHDLRSKVLASPGRN